MGILVQAGPLRERITIQSLTDGTDVRGGLTETWATFATRWAAVRPLTGRERFTDQQMEADISHEFTIRHTSGVTPKMRISWDNRTFDVAAVINVDERDRLQLVFAKERT